jgi:HNH endonuclease
MSFVAEVPVDTEGLTSAMRVSDRYAARVTVAVGEYTVGREWDRQGYANPVQWLKHAAGMTGPDAYRMVQEARKLRSLPVLTAAWLAGEVTGGQVRIICTQVIDRHLPLFAQHEAALVPGLGGLNIDDTLTAMRLWRERADALDEGPEPDAEHCEARLSPTLDNRGVLNANLDAEGYALAKEALGLADSNEFEIPAPERRGDALKLILRFFVERQTSKTVRKQRPHLSVVINADTLGTDLPEAVFATSGMPVGRDALEQMLCDCELHRMLHASGEVLDYGRAERTAPAALYNALVVRDGGCRFPECDRPPEDCEVHHVKPYSVGGETSIDNSVLGCWSHHPVLHRDGWSSALARDGTFTVTSPAGVTRKSLPRVITIEHLRAMVGLNPYPDDDPPIVDHAWELEGELAFRRRVNALLERAQIVRAIVNTVSLGTRPGWRRLEEAH